MEFAVSRCKLGLIKCKSAVDFDRIFIFDTNQFLPDFPFLNKSACATIRALKK